MQSNLEEGVKTPSSFLLCLLHLTSMNTTNLIAFDFDGTLYPLNPYDSEQMLLRSIAKTQGTLWAKRTKHLIIQDQKGALLGTSWHSRYERFIRKAKEEMISEVAMKLIHHMDIQTREALLALSEQADLAIISCGTENLIKEFLSALDLLDCFSLIKGKRIIFDPSGPPRLSVDIGSPQDKSRLIAQLRQSYTHIVAIGDGPTDIPMLQSADLGLIVDWTQKNPSYPYPVHSTLISAIKSAQDYLERASLA